MEKTNDVIGLGNALMDFLVEVDDHHLMEFDLKKGEMHLVEEEKAKVFLNKIKEHKLSIEKVPGGCSANTLKGIAFLGGKSILCGKIGEDEHGDVYEQQLKDYGVVTRLNKHPSITGHALTFITPDSERTFSVHLGASINLAKEDILEEDIMKSKVLYLEGFQLEGPTKETVLHAIELAKRHDTLVTIDLNDPGLIQRNKELLKEIVMNHADIVFVNENEAREFTGLEEEEAAKEIGRHTKIAVVKLGEKGSLICHNNEVIRIKSFPANVVDTTGAGDTFASGFLYGYCQNWNLDKAGELGSLLASKVIEQKGVGIRDIDGEELKEKVLGEEVSEMEESGAIVKVGVIGGSGLDNADILQDAKDVEVETPYGKLLLKIGKINGIDVILLARHGREHTIPPTHVNNRANIYALREAGCTHILATTACGSLREEIGRGDFVILDQFIDFTRHRSLTYYDKFEQGNINHTPMAEPFDKKLREILVGTCNELGLKNHKKGTVVTIEGPRFSTKAESHMFRSWGADVINMSIAPEAILANEMGIPYAAVAMSTDYDCWKEDEKPVTWEEVLEVFRENVDKVTNLLVKTIPKIRGGDDIECQCCKNCESEEKIEFDLKTSIRTIPNWPKGGVMFRDITTLLENPVAFDYCIQKFKERYQDKNITKVAGIESRGFIFGAALARELGLPFVLIRKKGKLPGETIIQEYEKEYGLDQIEIHKDAVKEGDNILITDDLLATGGTMKAACRLVEKLNGNVAGVAFVIDLPDLKGREKLTNYDVFHLVAYEGE